MEREGLGDTYLVKGMNVEVAFSGAGIIGEKDGGVAGKPGARNVAKGVGMEDIAKESEDEKSKDEKSEHSCCDISCTARWRKL
jgi:hypothetical protein